MRHLLVFLLFLTVSACTSIDQAHDRAKDISDFEVKAGRVAYCDVPRIGALKREFERNPEGLREYLEACGWGDQHIEAFIRAKGSGGR